MSAKKLSDEFIKSLPYAKGDDVAVYRDAALPGLALHVGKRSKTFVLQRERPRRFGPRKTFIKKIGSAPLMPLAEARERAVVKMRQIDEGIDPNAALPSVPGANDITLADAWASFRTALVKRPASPATLKAYDRAFENLKPLHGTTLRRLSDEPSLAASLHEKLSEPRKVGNTARYVGGASIADAAMRMLSAVYHYTREKVVRGLPQDSPISAVDLNRQEPDATGMSTSDLPKWFAQREQIENPIQRELALFLLLSGLRRTDCCTARWSELDLKKRVLFRPSPKGGAKNAFDLVLSKAMLRCLWRVRRVGRILFPENSEWIFPAATQAGHITQLAKGMDFVGHDLRRSYAAICEEIGIPESSVGRLLNHTVGKSMPRRYSRSNPLLGLMLETQEKISRHIMAAR